MKEHRIMQIQYLTAVAALFLVSFHLLLQGVLVPYSTALDFNHVLSLYRTWWYGGLLELLLVVIVVHGFNGLRIMLLELRQGRTWTKGVNWLILLAIFVAIAVGTHTVIAAALGPVS